MRPPRDALVVLALAGLLLTIGLGTVALTDRDEGANAEAAREMLERRSWISPTLGGAPRFAKPAFVYWLMAGAYAALGVGETAARLPSAVAAFLLVLTQYAFVRWALGPEVAWRAALVLLLSIEYVAIGRMALTDATLALWTTAAAYAFLRGWLGAPPRGRWYALAWIAAGLAVLTKGPVGLLVPLGGSWRTWRSPAGLRQAWREAWPLRGLGLFLLVAAPWYLAMFWLHGWDYAARARGETLGRVLRPVTGPGGTALFYLPVLLVGFFPWSAFLPGGRRGALRGARARARQNRAARRDRLRRGLAHRGPGALLAGSDPTASLRPALFPAAALLVAASWPARPSRLSRILLGGTAIVLAVLLVAAWVASDQLVRLLAPAYPAAASAALPATALVVAVLVAGVGAAALIRDGRRLFQDARGAQRARSDRGFQAALPAFSAQFVAPAGELADRARPGSRVPAIRWRRSAPTGRASSSTRGAP